MASPSQILTSPLSSPYAVFYSYEELNSYFSELSLDKEEIHQSHLEEHEEKAICLYKPPIPSSKYDAERERKAFERINALFFDQLPDQNTLDFLKTRTMKVAQQLGKREERKMCLLRYAEEILPDELVILIFSFLPTKLLTRILAYSMKDPFIQKCLASFFYTQHDIPYFASKLLSRLLGSVPNQSIVKLFHSISDIRSFNDMCFSLTPKQAVSLIQNCPHLTSFSIALGATQVACSQTNENGKTLFLTSIQKHQAIQKLQYEIVIDEFEEEECILQNPLIKNEGKSSFENTSPKVVLTSINHIKLHIAIQYLFGSSSHSSSWKMIARQLAGPWLKGCKYNSFTDRFHDITYLLQNASSIALDMVFDNRQPLLFTPYHTDCTLLNIIGDITDEALISTAFQKALQKARHLVLQMSDTNDEGIHTLLQQTLRLNSLTILNHSSITGDFFSSLDSSQLISVHFWGCTILEKNHFCSFLERCKDLQELSFPFELTQEDAYLLSSFPRLHTLKIAIGTKSHNALSTLLSTSPSLLHLEVVGELENKIDLEAVSFPPTLKSLHLQNCVLRNVETLCTLSLHTLCIEECDIEARLLYPRPVTNNAAFSSLFLVDAASELLDIFFSHPETLSQVRKLAIHSSYVSENHYRNICQIPYLQELDLAGCILEGASSIKTYPKLPQTISKLCLSYTNGFVTSLHEFITYPNLTILLLSNCHEQSLQASYKDLIALIDTTSIEILDMQDWDIDTEDQLRLQSKYPYVKFLWNFD